MLGSHDRVVKKSFTVIMYTINKYTSYDVGVEATLN